MADMLDVEALVALGLGPDGALGWNKLPGGGGGGAAGPPLDGAAAAWGHTCINNLVQSQLVITSDQVQKEIMRRDSADGRLQQSGCKDSSTLYVHILPSAQLVLQAQASALMGIARPDMTGHQSCHTLSHQQQHHFQRLHELARKHQVKG